MRNIQDFLQVSYSEDLAFVATTTKDLIPCPELQVLLHKISN
jgi:hypothetical protein